MQRVGKDVKKEDSLLSKEKDKYVALVWQGSILYIIFSKGFYLELCDRETKYSSDYFF